jgi:hypothetical protein
VKRWKVHLSPPAEIQLYDQDVDSLVQAHLDSAARARSAHPHKQVVGKGRSSVWFISFPSIGRVYIVTEGELVDAQLGGDQVRELWSRKGY